MLLPDNNKLLLQDGMEFIQHRDDAGAFNAAAVVSFLCIILQLILNIRQYCIPVFITLQHFSHIHKAFERAL